MFIHMVDTFKEERLLHIIGRNSRDIVKARLLHLLDCQRDFHKTLHYMVEKVWDDNAAFFIPWPHDYMQNNIAKVTMADGREVVDHSKKL